MILFCFLRMSLERIRMSLGHIRMFLEHTRMSQGASGKLHLR